MKTSEAGKKFIKLKELFPGNEELWIKYSGQRLRQFENKEIDLIFYACFLKPRNAVCLGKS